MLCARPRAQNIHTGHGLLLSHWGASEWNSQEVRFPREVVWGRKVSPGSRERSPDEGLSERMLRGGSPEEMQWAVVFPELKATRNPEAEPKAGKQEDSVTKHLIGTMRTSDSS